MVFKMVSEDVRGVSRSPRWIQETSGMLQRVLESIRELQELPEDLRGVSKGSQEDYGDIMRSQGISRPF